MHKDELEKLVRERLSGYEHKPEAGLEVGIFNTLAEVQKKLLLKKLALAIATLLLIGTAALITISETEYLESKWVVNRENARPAVAETELENAEVNKSKSTQQSGAELFDELPADENGDKDVASGNPEIPPITEHIKSPAGRQEQESGIKTAESAPSIEKVSSEGAKTNASNRFQRWRSRPVTGVFSMGLNVPQLSFDFSPEPAEEKVIVPQKERKWAVYGEVMPFFNYNYFEVDKTDDLLVINLQQQSALSFRRIGWRAETGLEHDISPRLRLQTGLMVYSRKQEAVLITSTIDTVVAEQIADRHTMKPVFSEDTIRMSVDLFNVGWIVGLQYKITDGHVKQWLGLSAEMHKGLKRLVAFENLVAGKQPSAYYTFANLYYRAEYQWKSRLMLFAQPTFNYNLYISEKLQAPVNIRPFGLGASVGVRWKM